MARRDVGRGRARANQCARKSVRFRLQLFDRLYPGRDRQLPARDDADRRDGDGRGDLRVDDRATATAHRGGGVGRGENRVQDGVKGLEPDRLRLPP